MPDDKDYFQQLASRAKPIQDAVGRASVAKPAIPTKVAKPAEPAKVAAYKLYDDADYSYMKGAVERSNRKQFKAGPGKSSPKR